MNCSSFTDPAVFKSTFRLNVEPFTHLSAAAWHTDADSPPDAGWGSWLLCLSPAALLLSDFPTASLVLVTSDQHESESSKAKTSGAENVFWAARWDILTTQHTCSLKAWEVESSFCCKVNSAASCCSFMTARSLSCCSRALDRVSERQSSSICCFILSTAASATRCFFKFCKHSSAAQYVGQT